jgi:hypothetical protein
LEDDVQGSDSVGLEVMLGIYCYQHRMICSCNNQCRCICHEGYPTILSAFWPSVARLVSLWRFRHTRVIRYTKRCVRHTRYMVTFPHLPIPTYSARPYQNACLLKNSRAAEGALSRYINSSKCQGRNRFIEETHITKNAETAGSLASSKHPLNLTFC